LLDKGVYLNGDSGIENLLILSKYGKQIEALGALLQGAYFTKKEVDLSILDNLASEVPLAKDNIIFRRYLPTQGTDLVMTLNPLADLVGFKMETTPGEIYRSALECFGFEVRRAIEKLESRPTYLCANGGGARSHVWTKIVSNIVNLPQYFSQESTGAYGNALLAGYATKGLDLDIVMQNFLNASDIIESDRSSLEIYDHLYQRYIA
jgi:xylulokinase